MRGIIIVAGRGLRMLPMTSFSPKCLLPIGDTTFSIMAVELLRNADVQTSIVTGHQAELIEHNDIVKIQTRISPTITFCTPCYMRANSSPTT